MICCCLPVGRESGAEFDRGKSGPAGDGLSLEEGQLGLLVAETGFTSMFVSYAEDGSRQDLKVSPAPTGSTAVSASGEVAYVSQSGTREAEVYLWDREGGEAKQISHLNDAWKEFALVCRSITSTNRLMGWRFRRRLLRPAGADAKAKLPLIALIHGGPTGRWSDSVDTWGQLLATHGYAVFYPNIRGSVGYGQKFVESNRGDWGGGDFKDVMAGVKDLVDRGIADPNRLGDRRMVLWRVHGGVGDHADQ